MTRYILDENDQPVLCPDLLVWGAWFEDAKFGHWRAVNMVGVSQRWSRRLRYRVRCGWEWFKDAAFRIAREAQR